MPEHFVEGNAAIWFAAGKGETGRGSSERFEAEMFQINRRADIPWVGQDKTARLMQSTKLCDCGQLRIFHFPMCICLAKSLKPTRVVVPHTSQRYKAASSLRFAAALHRMARFWVASVARHRFNAGARVFEISWQICLVIYLYERFAKSSISGRGVEASAR